jgi:hypothetical protein
VQPIIGSDHLPFFSQGHSPSIQSAMWLGLVSGNPANYVIALDGNNVTLSKDNKYRGLCKGDSNTVALDIPFALAPANPAALEDLALVAHHTLGSRAIGELSRPRPPQGEPGPRVPPQPDGPEAKPQDRAGQMPVAPKIELPNGGSAIRPIREKYTANPATGAGTCSLPMCTSPACSDFAPQLSLTYDPGSGSGLFGVGWSPGPPAITRETEKGLPRYFDAKEPDFFILSGSEDLVQSDRPNEGDAVKGARDTGTHRVKCCRPRLERLFSRIEKWTRKADGDIHWRARSTDDVTHVYGETVQARIAEPDDPQRVFHFALEYSYDDRGNVLAYRYRLEDGSQIPLALWDGGRRNTNTYPDRILYGNRAPYEPAQSPSIVPTDYLYEVVFDYGEHAAVPPLEIPPYEPPVPWTVRADRHSTYKATFEIRTARLCQRVLMFHRHDKLTPNPYVMRATELSYDGDPALAHLVAATQAGFIAGRPLLRYPSIELSYSKARPHNSAARAPRGPIAVPSRGGTDHSRLSALPIQRAEVRPVLNIRVVGREDRHG